MRFFIYSRKSKFTGKGESVENQIELCKEYILRNYPDANEKDIFVFEDEGFSGKSLDRPRFKKMMAEHKRNPANFIVVYRLDRISRNVSDFSGLMDMFQNTKTNFISINEKFDTSTPMGRAMINIAAVFAQLERETIAERVRDNMVMLARTGRWLGGRTPIGYDSERVQNIDFEGKSRSSYKLIPNIEEESVIRLIFRLFLEIQSLTGVEKKLFAQGITPRSGNFNAMMIKNIITHPVYCIADSVSYKYLAENGCDLCFDENEIGGKYGYSTYNRTKSMNSLGTKRARADKSEWIISLGKHMGLIKGEEWVRANRIIDGNKPSSRSRKVHSQTALLSGILRCGICGCAMRPKTVTYYKSGDKDNIFDYMCELKERSGRIKCNCRNIHGNDLDGAIRNMLFEFDEEDNVTAERFKRLYADTDTKSDSKADEIIRLEKTIAEKERMIGNLVISMAKSSDDNVVKYAEEQISKFDKEINDIKEELGKHRNNELLSEAVNHSVNNKKDAILALKRDWDNLSVPERRELLKMFIDRIVWNSNGAIDIFIEK